jgi:FkbM family methyltransferase
MIKYLVKSALDVLRDEGILGLIRELLKFVSLYGSPKKLLSWKITSWLNKDTLIIKNIQGSLMALKLSKSGIHNDLYMYGYREPQATKTMQAIMHRNMTVLDIGANIGYYALMEAKHCKYVYAVEPGKDNIEDLQRNILLNNYKNIKTYSLAIGSHDGEVKFLLNKSPNWHRVARDNEQGETVPIKRLDTFWTELGKPQIDLLRMDVEGYELNILKSGLELIETCKPQMFIEVHPEHIKNYGGSALELLKLLAQYEYSVTYAYVIGKPAQTGKLRMLLTFKDAVKALTERGMASHLFFGVKE